MAVNETERDWLRLVHTGDMIDDAIEALKMIDASVEERRTHVGNMVRLLEEEKLDDKWADRDWTTLDTQIAAGRSFWKTGS